MTDIADESGPPDGAAAGDAANPTNYFLCRCIVCGTAFSYQHSGPGRRRRFCSAACSRQQHKLNKRRYAAEDRYGVRSAALAKRDAKYGELLPLEFPPSPADKSP